MNAADPFKRLVARTLAQQYASEFRAATSPHNFGMSAHSGIENIIHFLRTQTDLDPNLCITKIDGVGAFDHIYRSQMLNKLISLPTAHRLIPFVRASYADTSTYIWTDSNGISHQIPQAEGGEQGDALMPALFSLGLHDALHEVSLICRSEEKVLAYLDDVYILSSRDRARPLYDILTTKIRNSTGIEPNLGKTECWSSGGGHAPPGIDQLNAPPPADPVWKGNLPQELNGLEILGSPVGHPAYIAKKLKDKLEEENKLLVNLVKIPHVQTAWLLLFYCGCPRAKYVLRTVPPNLCEDYRSQRDSKIRSTLAKILQVEDSLLNTVTCVSQIHMPARFGGLGLISCNHTSSAAYWASWCDSLPGLQARIPGFAQIFIDQMVLLSNNRDSSSLHTALSNLHDAVLQLQNEGFHTMPTWQAILNDQIPPQEDPLDCEPGEPKRGWQRLATKDGNIHRFNRFLASLNVSHQARIRSCGGPNSSRWLYALPVEKSFTMSCPIFRCALFRRLGFPIEPNADRCEGCRRILDPYGFHRTTCMRSGRVQTRHKPLIRVWQRIFREAGVPIPKRNIERCLHTTHIRRNENDMRRVDFISSGIDGVLGGSPLFADVTIVSPLRGTGRPMPRSSREDGAAVRRAEIRNREVDYPDIEAASSAVLLSLGCETYGRWSSHSLNLIRQLCQYRAKNAPIYLQNSLRVSMFARWWGLLSIGVQTLVGETILKLEGYDLQEAADNTSLAPIEDLIDWHR